MRRQYSKDPEIDRSLHHSIKDGVAYSVMTGAGETYFSAFAIHLKASTAQIGLLASLPSLFASLAQLLSAWIGHRSDRRRGIILTGALLQAITWLPLIILPLVFPEWSIPILITCIVLYHAAGNFVVPQWSSLMGDLVPEKRRGRYFALRTRYATITAFMALVTGGLILHLFEEYRYATAGFVCIFFLATLARFISVYHLSRMIDPPGKVAAMEIPTSKAWRQRLRHSPFVRFSIFFAFMQFSVAMAGPFFAVYMLRDLKFTYMEFMINTAASVLMQFLTLNIWGRISDAFGNRLILVLTGFLIPVLPALWIVSPNFWYLLGVQVFAGLAWAGFSLSSGNYLYELVPSHKRSTFMAIHNVFTNVGIFAGALLGAYLGSVLPASITLWEHSFTWGSVFYGVFLFSSAGRFITALLFLPHLKEMRDVRPMSVKGLIYRVSRFNAVTGMLYSVIGSFRREEKPEAKSENLPGK